MKRALAILVLTLAGFASFPSTALASDDDGHIATAFCHNGHIIIVDGSAGPAHQQHLDEGDILLQSNLRMVLRDVFGYKSGDKCGSPQTQECPNGQGITITISADDECPELEEPSEPIPPVTPETTSPPTSTSTVNSPPESAVSTTTTPSTPSPSTLIPTAPATRSTPSPLAELPRTGLGSWLIGLGLWLVIIGGVIWFVAKLLD
jgi:hypothetical protein